MSILISGDFHNNENGEISTILKTELIKKYQQDKYDEIKYHIILGDAGFLHHENSKLENHNNNILKERNFPILCVFGNHDPVLGRNDLPEIDIGIGENVILVRKKNPFIAYLKRGYVYNIDGLKFLVLGGASTSNKELFISHGNWWKEEYWSEEEKKHLFKLLKKDNSFDYILSHTAPININYATNPFRRFGFKPLFIDEVAVLNEDIDSIITCKQWFCGHLHKDLLYYNEDLKRRYQFLYRKTALLTKDGIEVL